MLRKIMLTLATGAALGAAALTPTSASAHWAGGHWGGGHWGGHWGFYRPGIRIYAGPVVYGGCMVQRWVYTPWGLRLRWVNRCY
jgi:hypothetical protein